MRYSEAEKRVVYEPVALPQDFRTFDFLMPWEGPEYRLPGDEKATPRRPARLAGTGASRSSTVNPKTPANAEDDREAGRHGGKPADARRPRKRASRRQAKAPRKSASSERPNPKPKAPPAQGEARHDRHPHRRDERRRARRAGDSRPTARRRRLSNYTINFGPQHPAAHGVLRLILELDGEIVERVDPHIGLLHRGTEKLIEYKTYAQALPYFDRLDYCSPMCMEHSFVLAIEKLMGLEVPIRAQYIRVLMAELTRISNHMLNLGSHIMDVGAMTPEPVAVRGARGHAAILRAGVRRAHARQLLPRGRRRYDLTEKLLVDIGDWLDNRLHLFEDAISLVADNRIFKQRNVDIGVVSKEDAIAWGFSGPMIRAAGVPWDIRRSQPYEVYDRMEFDIPVGTNSDCYDRFMVRSRKCGSRRGSCASASRKCRRARSAPTTRRCSRRAAPR